MNLTEALQRGATHTWLFVPTAILLGALHGLEPGHSKTMMAAFIIAVRGTITQAILLGLSAAISHSLIIWALAAAALHYGSNWSAEATEPYFQIASGVMIGGLGAWMFWRVRRDQRLAAEHARAHENEGPHHGQLVETGQGWVEISVFENGVPPCFRLYFFDAQLQPRPAPDAIPVQLQTRRDDGSIQEFLLQRRSGVGGESYLESIVEIPEPHQFTVLLALEHAGGTRRHEAVFSEDEHHHHHHADLSNLTADEYADAHEREHAADIAQRFTNRAVTTPQIVWFGVTGGLMPCPAAFTVLLVCLQLKRVTLGFALVGAFSFGLALTMVASGVLAAWGVRHAEKRFRHFGDFARRAPYASAALMLVLAVVFIVQGWRHLG
jgi:nickel/cobalt exporter